MAMKSLGSSTLALWVKTALTAIVVLGSLLLVGKKQLVWIIPRFALGLK